MELQSGQFPTYLIIGHPDLGGPTYLTIGQPDLGGPSLRLCSLMSLDCAILAIKTNYTPTPWDVTVSGERGIKKVIHLR